jgi:D-xylose transport system substrate-binding protein
MIVIMEKKYSLLCVVLIIMLFITNCTRNKQKSVGFLLPNMTDNRYPKDKDNFVSIMNAKGINIKVCDAKNDATLQEVQANELIENGVEVIVIIAVNQNSAAAIVRKAHDKGIKVIAYERLINNCDLDYFIGFDHYQVGKIQANYAIQLKPEGNYVLIGGDKRDRNAENIKQGQLDIINPHIKNHKIEVVYNCFVEDWDSENAYREMKNVLNLSGKKIDVVLCSNDNIASGAIKALNELQSDYPAIITGLDANLEACRLIVQGKQTMTVYKPIKIQAELAADMVIKILNKDQIIVTGNSTFNESKYIPTWVLQPIGIDIKNMDQTVIKDGFLQKSDIY